MYVHCCYDRHHPYSHQGLSYAQTIAVICSYTEPCPSCMHEQPVCMNNSHHMHERQLSYAKPTAAVCSCAVPVSWHSGVSSDCHGFWNPCGLQVGYTGVRVWVSFLQPSLYLYPRRGLAVYPPSWWRVFHRSLNWDQPWPTWLISLSTTPTTSCWTQQRWQDTSNGK